MKACTFFGHRDCPDSIKAGLRDAIVTLISQGVDTFYVGNNGQFDACVRSVLRQLQGEYPQLQYAVVLDQLPTRKDADEDASDTMFPEELEGSLPKFAVDHRNWWMVDRADWVICYVRHSWGGAYKFSALAKRHGKKIVNLDGFQF